jgi:hypothetical protein
MNNFFKKIEIKVSEFDWMSIKGSLVAEYKYTPNLSYYDIQDHQKVKELLPEELFQIKPYQLKFVEISGVGVLPPHVDYGVTCAFNYYFKPSRSTVIFYNQKLNATKISNDETQSHLFNYKDLEPMGKFTADVGDGYLINVSKVHEVIHFNKEPRQFLQIQWKNQDFESIVKILNDTGKN